MEIKEVVATDFTESGKRTGLALIAIAGLVSVLASLVLLSYLVFGFIDRGFNGSSHRLESSWTKFVRAPLGKYLMSFVLADLIQGIAFCLNYRWAITGHMSDGVFCLVQGSASQVGNLGTALWSNILAFQTCLMLLDLRNRLPIKFEACVLIVVWSIIILLPILGSTVIQNFHNGLFWGLSGAWCWISDEYQVSRLLFLYVWVYFNLLTCFCLYSLVYLKITGVVEYRRDTIFKLRWVRSTQGRTNRTSIWTKIRAFWRGEDGENQHPGMDSPQSSSLVNKDNVRVARLLMLHPIGYGFVVTPIVVCRMGVLAGWTPPFWLYTLAGICLASSGLMNASIYFVTRYSFIRRNMPWSSGITTAPHFRVTIDDVDGSIPMTPLARRPPPSYPVLHIGIGKHGLPGAEEGTISGQDGVNSSATELVSRDGSDSSTKLPESGQAKRRWPCDDHSFDFLSNNHKSPTLESS